MGDAGFDVAAARAAFPALDQKQVFMDVCHSHRKFNDTLSDAHYRMLEVRRSCSR